MLRRPDAIASGPPSISASSAPTAATASCAIPHGSQSGSRVPLLPLYHFERRFVIDLQEQIFKSDGQMPTVYPPQNFSLEFTRKFEPPLMLAPPIPIGINRLLRWPA